ncbi:N-carbamoyl-L-amino-acid hydrolase [Clostridium algifaecis]|uniref:N-carbamoyl-L-amino-acid hydrolase n=1 Tax=Clostridium algifaecis TaxID=1472040 RepID=A0ABS4KMV0_9CLOT|nr:M20 family metallo-hydrolase [Clostridium algifaecis]MBP2031345.1 N-carbamoyl-L-amino-acid hydrolase [Clostridium algifaecis]
MGKIEDLKLLNGWFNEFSSIGQNKIGGVTRLAYSFDENNMHETFKKICEKLCFHVKSDSVGNTFVSLKESDSRKPYLIASHLDSVPNGGKYDGVLGVIGGILILKWIRDNNIDIPVKVCAFRCEESSAFGKATIGSGLITGKIKEKDLCSLKGVREESLYDILKSKGYLSQNYSVEALQGYIEMHIEQGRVLYDNKVEAGIVTAIAGSKRFKLEIHGRQDHSGATPMSMRKDALSAASEVILEIEKLGIQESIHSTVATVGEIHETPNALNVVPGFVELGIDIRGIESSSINSLISQLKCNIKNIMNKRNLSYELIPTTLGEPVKLSNQVIGGLYEAAKKLGIGCIKMPSGAGHDAMEFADITKTGMVFIPCKEGISHNPKEEADLSDLLNACKIVYEYLKEVLP